MFLWKDAYSVNIAVIDEQHKRLFEIAGNLYDLMKKKNDDIYDELNATLKELKDYTVYHFNFEEDLMKKYGYPELSAHVVEHTSFIEKIMAVEELDIDEAQKKVQLDLIMFLVDWVTNHILKRDHMYVSFFNQKGLQ